jgi:hypothetical protein
VLGEEVQAIGYELQADLQELVRVAKNLWQSRIQLGSYLYLKSIPLGLSELDGSAHESIEVERSFGGRCLAREADETGNQRFRTAYVLADLGRERTLLRAEGGVQEEIRIPEHGSDRVVELVRCASD